tara:strand:+ start:173 stop:391 length:219 start_codon:yes stop_codon:yes gene_type:complete
MEDQKRLLGKELCAAARQHFEAEKAQALINLKVYLQNPVGVSDHPNLVKEIIELIRKIAEANDCIATLESIK